MAIISVKNCLGNVIKQKSFKREDIVLFTKCGLLLPDSSRPKYVFRISIPPVSIFLKALDNSLKTAYRDYIDIFAE